MEETEKRKRETERRSDRHQRRSAVRAQMRSWIPHGDTAGYDVYVVGGQARRLPAPCASPHTQWRVAVTGAGRSVRPTKRRRRRPPSSGCGCAPCTSWCVLCKSALAPRTLSRARNRKTSTRPCDLGPMPQALGPPRACLRCAADGPVPVSGVTQLGRACSRSLRARQNGANTHM